jgi:hypothetical protein
MVPVAIAGNISGEATTPSGNIFNEATRGTARCHAGKQSSHHLSRMRRPRSIRVGSFRTEIRRSRAGGRECAHLASEPSCHDRRHPVFQGARVTCNRDSNRSEEPKVNIVRRLSPRRVDSSAEPSSPRISIAASKFYGCDSSYACGSPGECSVSDAAFERIGVADR